MRMKLLSYLPTIPFPNQTVEGVWIYYYVSSISLPLPFLHPKANTCPRDVRIHTIQTLVKEGKVKWEEEEEGEEGRRRGGGVISFPRPTRLIRDYLKVLKGWLTLSTF